VRDLAGQSEEMHVDRTTRWVAEELVRYVAEEGRAWLESHRRRGHRIALITASPRYTADPLAAALGLAPEDVLATRFEVQNGRFTGRLLEPMLYGTGKVSAAMDYARRHGLNLASSFFYTDSISDLPLLETVGYPVAVNPDRPLRRLAEARGWSIVRFY
jgi:putative phosphoserine phosphatase/1-acylglycerol-3-phosphate O-acyltransferase